MTQIAVNVEADEADPLARFAQLLADAPDVDVPLYDGGAVYVNLRSYPRWHAQRYRETGRPQELHELELCCAAWERWKVDRARETGIRAGNLARQKELTKPS